MTPLGYALLGLSGLIALVVFFYNRLVALRQTTRNAFADIDVQLRQRYDLVPNLVETVKGYATHEKELFTKVTDARARAMQSGASLPAKGEAEAALTGALMQLMAVAENYPDLKANANFQQLQGELSDIENKIAAARRFFNNAVTEYNIAIEQFPSVLIAKAFCFAPADTFSLGEERASAGAAPKVSF